MTPIADVQSLNVLPVPVADLASVLALVGMSDGPPPADLASGDVMLWVVIEGEAPPVLRAAFATQITEVDGRPFVDVAGLSGQRRGDVARLMQAIDAQMQEHARRMGCAGVRFVGRDAYKRLLPGYRVRGLRNAWPIFERVL